jgi:hypothetical protein
VKDFVRDRLRNDPVALREQQRLYGYLTGALRSYVAAIGVITNREGAGVVKSVAGMRMAFFAGLDDTRIESPSARATVDVTTTMAMNQKESHSRNHEPMGSS